MTSCLQRRGEHVKAATSNERWKSTDYELPEEGLTLGSGGKNEVREPRVVYWR